MSKKAASWIIALAVVLAVIWIFAARVIDIARPYIGQ